MSASIQDQVVALAKPQLEKLVEKTKANFMEAFGDFVESSHKDRLEKLIKEAAEAKLKAIAESDSAKSKMWEDVANTKLDSIQTLGLAVKIVGAAKAHSFLKEAAKQVLDTLAGVAAGVLKAVVAGLVQGVVTGLTGGAAPAIGGGIASVAGSFLGEPE